MHAEETLDLILEAAERLGLQPKQESSYGLFSIGLLGKRHYCFYSTSPLNTELASYLASNKHATRLMLEEYGLPNIPYLLPDSKAEVDNFFKLHGEVIAKPTRGRQSKNVHLITSQHQLDRLPFQDMIFEKFIDGTELRYLLLDDTVLAVHHRDFPGRIHDPTKVQRTSLNKKDWNNKHIAIAKRTMKTIGLRFGAVDFIAVNDQPYILEVNSAPGLYYFKSPHHGPSIDIGILYLQAVAGELWPDWKSPL